MYKGLFKIKLINRDKTLYYSATGYNLPKANVFPYGFPQLPLWQGGEARLDVYRMRMMIHLFLFAATSSPTIDSPHSHQLSPFPPLFSYINLPHLPRR